jgi:hypothetical protein
MNACKCRDLVAAGLLCRRSHVTHRHIKNACHQLKLRINMLLTRRVAIDEVAQVQQEVERGVVGVECSNCLLQFPRYLPKALAAALGAAIG